MMKITTTETITLPEDPIPGVPMGADAHLIMVWGSSPTALKPLHVERHRAENVGNIWDNETALCGKEVPVSRRVWGLDEGYTFTICNKCISALKAGE